MYDASLYIQKLMLMNSSCAFQWDFVRGDLMKPFFINLTVASKIIKHFNLLILSLVGGAKSFPSVSPMNKK